MWATQSMRLTTVSADTLSGQEVVFGLPKLGARVSDGVCTELLLPAFRRLAADRVWLVRGSAAASLPAMAGLLPPGMHPPLPLASCQHPLPAQDMHTACCSQFALVLPLNLVFMS